MKAHCLFEQSGTFKKEFRKLGVESFDYDIQNEFGQTDFVVDLFAEIERAFEGGVSIFDDFTPEDVVMAFFPCTRFEAQISMQFRGEASQQMKWTEEKKLYQSMKLQKELTELYLLISKLCIVAIRKGLRMVIENPYTQPHYLTMYWCLKPGIIDKDRTENGDYFKKPTQYWFLGFKPKYNIIFEPLEYVEIQNIERSTSKDIDRKTKRSMIHPQYANRFIRQYILEETE